MSVSKPTLAVKEVSDIVIRKNFQNLVAYFGAQNQMQDFGFQELVITSAVTNQAIAHGLGVIPQDIIVTRLTGPGTIVFNYGKFTANNIFITTTGACRVRFFYGVYWAFQSSVPNNSTDTQAFSATI